MGVGYTGLLQIQRPKSPDLLPPPPPPPTLSWRCLFRFRLRHLSFRSKGKVRKSSASGVDAGGQGERGGHRGQDVERAGLIETRVLAVVRCVDSFAHGRAAKRCKFQMDSRVCQKFPSQMAKGGREWWLCRVKCGCRCVFGT